MRPATPYLLVPFLALCYSVVAPHPVPAAPAGETGATLVLPFRSVGVSDTTIAVVRDLLALDLEARGLQVVARQPGEPGLPAAADACDEADCARAAAEGRGAGQVVFGTLSKLGEKIIVRALALRLGEADPFYSDQLSATSIEDLDVVMLRIAEGIASGRPNSDLATIDSVTREEARRPRSKEGRTGLGFRAGILWPANKSYGGADHLTDLHLAWGFEGRNFRVETTALTGVRWGDGCVDWTLLDLFVARVFGLGDVATHLGGGLGLHAVHVETDSRVYSPDPTGYTYDYYGTDSQDATALSADIGAGVVLLRTYSFRILLDARYHYVFENFGDVNDKGAHGLLLTFGTSS